MMTTVSADRHMIQSNKKKEQEKDKFQVYNMYEERLCLIALLCSFFQCDFVWWSKNQRQ